MNQQVTENTKHPVLSDDEYERISMDIYIQKIRSFCLFVKKIGSNWYAMHFDYIYEDVQHNVAYAKKQGDLIGCLDDMVRFIIPFLKDNWTTKITEDNKDKYNHIQHLKTVYDYIQSEVFQFCYSISRSICHEYITVLVNIVKGLKDAMEEDTCPLFKELLQIIIVQVMNKHIDVVRKNEEKYLTKDEMSMQKRSPGTPLRSNSPFIKKTNRESFDADDSTNTALMQLNSQTNMAKLAIVNGITFFSRVIRDMDKEIPGSVTFDTLSEVIRSEGNRESGLYEKAFLLSAAEGCSTIQLNCVEIHNSTNYMSPCASPRKPMLKVIIDSLSIMDSYTQSPPCLKEDDIPVCDAQIDINIHNTFMIVIDALDISNSSLGPLLECHVHCADINCTKRHECKDYPKDDKYMIYSGHLDKEKKAYIYKNIKKIQKCIYKYLSKQYIFKSDVKPVIKSDIRQSELSSHWT